MNDVLNSEIHTDEAWRFHIPTAAWLLMLLIAIAGNLLLGLSEKRRSAATLVILPVIVSIPFFLIADIDSPRAGVIRGSCEPDRARPVDEAKTVEASVAAQIDGPALCAAAAACPIAAAGHRCPPRR